VGITEADAVETARDTWDGTHPNMPGLVWHSLVPDLLGPALAHHGLEPGLA